MEENTSKIIISLDYETQKNEASKIMNVDSFLCKLHEIDEECRRFIKYGHNFQNIEDALEYVRELIHQDGDITKWL